jgi:hypothetical protein
VSGKAAVCADVRHQRVQLIDEKDLLICWRDMMSENNRQRKWSERIQGAAHPGGKE